MNHSNTISSYMISYHGTSTAHARTLTADGVDVQLGGGELGRGFYTGQFLHEAKTWAFHKFGDRQSNVVSFITSDEHVGALTLILLDAFTAGRHRHYIRKNGETRSRLFECDMVWAPIVGSERATGDQFKWESPASQDLLNDSSKTRKDTI